MPVFDAVRNALFGYHRGEPIAVDRYTRTPIYRNENIDPLGDLLLGGITRGMFDPVRNAITVADPNNQKVLQHEILHSIFNKSNKGKGSSVLKRSNTKGKAPEDFEHEMIELLQNERFRDKEIDSLLEQAVSNEGEVETQRTLKKMFRRK